MPLQKARFKISDYAENRKHRLGHHERKIGMVSLSLTSMVDMFAILVIYLLSSSSTVTQWIEISQNIDLPQAKVTEIPSKSASIQITKEMIFAESTPLLSTRQAMTQESMTPLRNWLSRQKKHGYINIVAHQQLQFGILRNVISTCHESGFENVNLVVRPKT